MDPVQKLITHLPAGKETKTTNENLSKKSFFSCASVYCPAVTLTPMYTLDTACFFEATREQWERKRPKVARAASLSDMAHYSVMSGVGTRESRDSVAESDAFAVQEMFLCPLSGMLAVASRSSYVLLCMLSNKEKDVEVPVSSFSEANQIFFL